jgi:quinol monooxygenase YgiN
MSTNISWVLRVSIREGRLADFKSLMHEMVDSTQTESGALRYEWFLSANKNTCHLYERYADSDAVMAHLGNFGSKFAERFLAAVEPTSLSVYGEPSDAVRATLDGFGAEYLGSFGGFGR